MLWLWFLAKMWVPRRVRTEGTFNAADPWNGNRLTTFTIEVYKMVHRSAKAVVRDSAMLGKPKFGIKSEIDGEDRMLPEFLQQLWQEKKVASEALPELLHSIGPELKMNDFHVYGRSRRLIEVMVAVYTLGALCILGVSLKSYLGIHQAAAVHDLQPVRVALSDWQQAPWANDNVAVKGMAVADRATPLTTITVPADAEGFGISGYSVALTKSAQGHVMIVAPSNIVSPDNRYLINGIVEPTAALGLSPALLAELKQRAPDLDTDHAVCLYWRWKGEAYGGNPFMLVYVGFAMAAFVGLLAGIMALIFLPKFARRRRHAAWALQQVAMTHA